MTVDQIVQLIQSAVQFGTVIMFGAMGEILTEKSGNLNLGVPGIMYLGGIAGLAASFFYEFNNPDPSGLVCLVISFLAAFAASALGGLLYSFLTITLRANQNVTGLTLTIFGGGVANFFGGTLNTMAGGVGQISVATTSAVYRASIHSVTDFGLVGRLLLNYGFMVYLAIVLAVVLHFFLNRTRKGLNLRAVGENPATADAAGINVARNKYLATCVGAGISGLGGLYYTMDYIKGTWANDGTIESLGWLAVALVDLRHLAERQRHLGLLPLRPAVLGVPDHPRSGPAGHLPLQHAAVPGDHRGADLRLPAEQEGESAPCQPGSGLLPGGAVADRLSPIATRTPRLSAAAFLLLRCSVLRLVMPGGGEDVPHQHGPGHGAHAAGHRGDVGGLGLHRRRSPRRRRACPPRCGSWPRR